MAQLSRLVSRRMPGLTNIFGFVDGLSVPCQTSSDQFEQNAYYNGWKAGTFVNNIFVFSSEGKIVFASLNCPGSWHDSQVSLSLIRKVVQNIGEFKICVDQGFPRSGDLLNEFVGPISRRGYINLPKIWERDKKGSVKKTQRLCFTASK